ncbi:MAG: hypothetical protein COV45_09310 [Deltaproteobacteria bacterium CG11_big_fil_rev_8_21_14_0_20_47_16]|nr:MAG: hypothetical protein COV45_09310 [Deltaproteobacteria bacterium CG11_big_fil_rev_8_21_14_0_20_47_16]
MKSNILLIILSIAVSIPAFAGTGTLAGDVDDAYGTPLPGVIVTVTNADTSDAHTVATNSGGVFFAEDLPSGKYSAKAQMPGYKTASASNIKVKDGKMTKIKLIMVIGVD